jgi:hypothetical protein
LSGGAKGADKRIDVLSTAIEGGLSIFDLPKLELAYAPPFSSAKDQVNMLEGRVEAFQWYEVENLRETGPYILDVREPKEWKAGHIEEAMHIPLDRLRDSLLELPLAETIFVYCHAGLRGYLATRIL